MNGLILGEQWSAYFEAFGIAEFTIGQMTSFAVITFLFGIVLIWLYAATLITAGIYPMGLAVGTEARIAAVAGAWLYQEGETYGP